MWKNAIQTLSVVIIMSETEVFERVECYLSEIVEQQYVICLTLLLFILFPQLLGGELGGKNPLAKWTSAVFLVFLWFIYVILSSLKAYDIIKL